MRAARSLLVILLLLLGARVQARQDALILIDPDAAGPKVDPSTYFHPNWILWPPPDAAGSNLALSLLSGHDWRGETADASFQYDEPNHRWRSEGWTSLLRRGYFEARRANIGDVPAVLVTPGADALLLALTARSDLVSESRDLPSSAIALGRVHSWDEAKAVAARVSGRTLVVESPPPNGQRWSRFWTYAGDWPKGIPGGRVPGLLDARDAGRLLRQPSTFAWSTAPVEGWGGANRWLEAVRMPWTWTIFGLFWVVAGLVAWSASLIVRERRSLAFARLLSLAALLPAAVLASGNLCRVLGLGSWPYLLTLFILALPAAAWLLHVFTRRRFHPWVAVGLVGLVVCVSADPLWSAYSPVFGWFRSGVSGEAVGAVVGYAVLVVAFSGQTLAVWAVTLFGLLGAWWGVMPAVALLAPSRLYRTWIPWVLAGAGLGLVAARGLAWTPGGLLHEFGEAGRVDVSRHVQVLGSPSVALALIVALSAVAWGDRFFFRQARRLMAMDGRRRAPFRAAGVLLAVGVVEPSMIQAAQMVALGGLLLLLHDGVREL